MPPRVASLIVSYRAALRARARWLTIWIGGLAVIYAGFGAYYLGDHLSKVQTVHRPTSLGALWPVYSGGSEAILSGTWFYSCLAPLNPRLAVVWIVLALFAAGRSRAWPCHRPGISRWPACPWGRS